MNKILTIIALLFTVAIAYVYISMDAPTNTRQPYYTLSPTLTMKPSPIFTMLPTTTSTPTVIVLPTVTNTEVVPTYTIEVIPQPNGTMFGPPSLWPKDIDNILINTHAYGSGQVFWELGIAYNIDPAYLLAFFKKESSFGMDDNWSGKRNNTHNIGNIICTDNWKGECVGRFRKYNTWGEGAKDWYSLMSRKYNGMDIYSILDIYAPIEDGNNPTRYANQVIQLTQQWKTR